MPATGNNPDELQDQKQLRTRSEGLDQEFVFRRTTVRDRQKIDDEVWEYCGGKKNLITDNSANLYEACAILQVAMVSPDPKIYKFVDLEDAEGEIFALWGEYTGWKARFRAAAKPGAGKAGGAE